jgi:hypothetical protein
MERYLVIVSRDRPDLFQRLSAAYGHKVEVKILLDRRERKRGEYGVDRRSPRRAKMDFGSQGYIVIPQHERVSQAA